MLKMCKRLTAVFVSIAMLFTSISLESVAKTIPLQSSVSSDAMVTPSTTESEDSDVVIMGELVEKRESNIKHYRMKAVDFNSIVYSYKIGNHLKVVVEDDKNIAIVDKENNKLVMQISAPIMWDDAGNYYDNLKFEVVEEKNNQVKIRLEWDIEDDMVYPVTIDPVLSFSTNRLEIQDTYIIKSTATTNYNYKDHIKLRNDGYALLEFPTPDLSSGDKIVHAELVLAPYMFLDDATSEYSNVNSYNPPLHITTHKILRAWNEKTVTYQNANADGGFFDSTVYSYRILDNDNDFYTWDITRLANEWTEGGVANHGLLLNYRLYM